MKNFGVRLQTLRRNASMSQGDLASLVGVSRQAISKWERSEALPDLYNINKIADIFNISLDELVNDDLNRLKPEAKGNNKLALAFLTIPAVFAAIAAVAVLVSLIGVWG